MRCSAPMAGKPSKTPLDQAQGEREVKEVGAAAGSLPSNHDGKESQGYYSLTDGPRKDRHREGLPVITFPKGRTLKHVVGCCTTWSGGGASPSQGWGLGLQQDSGGPTPSS